MNFLCPDAPAGSKRALLAISFSVIKFAGSQPGETIEVVSNDVPRDANIISWHYDFHYDRLVLVLESASFPVTEQGQPLPWLRGPEFRIRKAQLVKPYPHTVMLETDPSAARVICERCGLTGTVAHGMVRWDTPAADNPFIPPQGR